MCGGMSPFSFRDIAVRFLKLAADEANGSKNDAASEEVAALRAQVASFESRFAALAAQSNAAPAPPQVDALAALAADNTATGKAATPKRTA